VNYVKLHPAATVPTQATPGAAAYDLYACEEAAIHGYQSRTTIDTGIAIELPYDCVALVCSRSGLAAKNGIFVLNSPGIIDSDYRGAIKVILSRLPLDTAWPSIEPSFIIKPGDRIAQLLILHLPLWRQPFKEVAELSPTQRGEGGLGSTGQKELPLVN
jgi:dUTP pyrophosphatase